MRTRKSLRTQENLPPKDPIEHSSDQEQTPIPQSSSLHLTHSLGVSQGGQGEVHCKGVMDHADLIKDLTLSGCSP